MSTSTNYILSALILVAVHDLVSLIMMIISFKVGQRGQALLWLTSLIVCIVVTVLLAIAYNDSRNDDNDDNSKPSRRFSR